MALDHWRDLDGWALSCGIPDLRTLPLDRFHSLVLYWWTRDAEPAEIQKFEAKLWQPPKGEAGQGPWSKAAESAAFAAFKAQVKPALPPE